MKDFTVSRTIEASVDEVWDALADFGNIYRWNPGVTNSYLTGDIDQGVGARRHCDLMPFGAIQERVMEWDDRQRLVIHIHETTAGMPIEEGVATFTLHPVDVETTEVRVVYEYKPNLLGRLVGGPTHKALVRGLGGLLKGLDRHVTDPAGAGS